MPNRLAQETSPYLLQHKDNPIDWWPWCDEAWELASRHGKPVFLSVGYSSCHWCHVMAHETFEDAEVAIALNRDFVCIKLDREERPDIDEVYMTAVQISSGQGGWPMSLFLTPDKKPFFAGTYFPREARGEFPGFLTIVGSLAKAWKEQRADVQKAADEFGTAISAAMERTLPTDLHRLDVGVLDQAVELLHQDFDDENGGFGTKPKFPPHAGLRFLLDYATMRPEMGGDFGDLPERAGHMALFTLEKMALGGIHDHVGGGFHRYSTDDRWLLPHFEKMLYDNAQLIGAYTHGAKVATEPRLQELFTRVARRAIDWAGREMLGEDGTFFSALDADSEGREGAHYLWTKADLIEVGESEEFLWAFQICGEGNFHDEATGKLTGENVLDLLVDHGSGFDGELARLLEARNERERPGRDHKAIAAWNGMMISSLSQAGYNEMAIGCAETWANQTVKLLPHMVTDTVASGEAFLDDLALMADGFLDILELTGDSRWKDLAFQLVEHAVQNHGDNDRGFFYVSKQSERLFGRSKPFLDNATPSPNGVMARVLRRLGRPTEALAVVRAGLGWVQRVPRATETLLREILWHLWENESEANFTERESTRLVVTLEPREITVDDDGWGYAEVVMSIPADVHINSNEPLAKWLSPTSVSIEGVFGEASFPESKEGIYCNEARIALRLRPKSGSSKFEVTVRYQACTESECLMPQETSLTGVLIVP